MLGAPFFEWSNDMRIEFRGVEVEYDEKCPKSYIWQKKLAKSDPAAIEQLLLGRDEEVAEKLGDDMDAMAELLQAITEDVKAKN